MPHPDLAPLHRLAAALDRGPPWPPALARVADAWAQRGPNERLRFLAETLTAEEREAALREVEKESGDG